MVRSHFRALALAWTLAAIPALGAVPEPKSPDADPSKAQPTSLAALSKRVQDLTDVILARHIGPPTRQQMILAGIEAVYRKAQVPVPGGLARRISMLSTPDQFVAFLAETWLNGPVEGGSAAGLEEAMIDGLLASVPGHASLMSAKELRANEQLAGNVYVGVHIAAGYDDKEKLPTIKEVFEGGPADRAGAKKDDLIEQIDGVSIRGLPLRESIERLRGDEGTEVVITVRRPRVDESLTFRITRGRMPRKTIQGVRRRDDGGWDFRLDGPAAIGYLRFEGIIGSTPHELRQLAGQLESEEIRALILDLRGADQATLHPTVLLADNLLDGQPIGRLRTTDRVTTYQADPDALFRGWPLAVLVDSGTFGAAAWLAAALQDNHRALIIGQPTHGDTDVHEAVPFGDAGWSIQLATGRLERADGRPLGGSGSSSLAVERRAPPQAAMRRQQGAGVIPDHQVTPPQPPQARRPPPARVRELNDSERSPDDGLARDPVVAEARQRLIKALEPSS